MTLSYSAIKDFEGCPRRYHEVKILKKYPRQETDATIWGTKVHLAAEEHVRDGKQFEFEFPGQDIVATLANLKGKKYCEMEMAVDDKLSPVEFDDPAAMLRGIADLVIIQGDKARCADYKTGNSKYPDVAQLELMALLLFARMPEIKRSHGALIFLKDGKLVQKITKREDAGNLWVNWLGKVQRVEAAHETGVWNPKPSALCPWCPVTNCEHWRPRRK